MAEYNGWIKLHRCLLGKAIWKCSNNDQKVILVTILLLANHEDNQWIWNGEKFTCKRGQFITSLSSLAKTCDVSTQVVRTALAKFEKLDFLTNQSTKTGRLITVVNWEFYQGLCDDANKPDNKEVTKYQQSINKEVTTNKNDKKEKNDKNNKKLTCEEAHRMVSDFGFSFVVQPTIDEWIDYKYERKDAYAPTGLKTLLKQIEIKVNANGCDYVIEVISNSMANSWKGIIWDAIKPRSVTKANELDDFYKMASDWAGGE